MTYTRDTLARRRRNETSNCIMCLTTRHPLTATSECEAARLQNGVVPSHVSQMLEGTRQRPTRIAVTAPGAGKTANMHDTVKHTAWTKVYNTWLQCMLCCFRLLCAMFAARRTGTSASTPSDLFFSQNGVGHDDVREYVPELRLRIHIVQLQYLYLSSTACEASNAVLEQPQTNL